VTEAEAQLIDWFAAEYVRRTKAVREGTAPISWVPADYRVSWTEIWAKAEELGIKRNVVDMRNWWAENCPKVRKK